MATNNGTNFSNPVTVPQGGTGAASFTAYAPIAGGTTSTGVLQSIGVGNSGDFLTSNGAGALPTYQASSSVNNLMATVTLTSAQVKALTTTPITIVSAPTSGTAILLISCACKMTYGGTNAFSGLHNICLKYTDNSGVNVVSILLSQSNFNTTSSRIANPPLSSIGSSSSLIDGQPVIIGNTGSAVGGNAAGNNTFTVVVVYTIVTL